MKLMQCLMSGILLLVSLGQSGQSLAQPDTSVSNEQLRDALAERDRIIIDLLNRVEQLEQRLADTDADSAGTLTAASPPMPQPVNSSTSTEGSSIDQLAAERALERSLVQQGSRLLAPGQVELTLSSTYSYGEQSWPTLQLVDSSQYVAEQRLQSDLLDVGVGLKWGLPFNSQLDVQLPYRWISLNAESRVDNELLQHSSRNGSGFGDIRLGVATRLLSENNGLPFLVGRLEWQTGSGKTADNGLLLGAGQQALRAQLNASWRRDPAVFFVGSGYSHFLEEAENSLSPGDGIELSLGAVLALSPETALTFSLDQGFYQNAKRSGQELPGSDRHLASLNIAASTYLARGLLLRLNAGIGLTEDTPDYQLGLSLPLRLDLF